jgi:hypothetical protein
MDILSLGAGVQSSTMALMAAHGEIEPMPDAAIFADTQFEPEGVYTHLNWLETQLPFPVYRVTAGNIKNDTLVGLNTTGHKFSAIPFFTQSGVGRRQCTREYKIAPIRRKISQLIGTKKKPESVRQWIGISTDEAMRMKPSGVKYIKNVWPLIDVGMSRQDCIGWFAKKYPNRVLAKSACIGCPFHNDVEWRDMKLNDADSWAIAVNFDRAIRRTGTNAVPQFIHDSRQPLEEVDFRNLEDMGQLNMFNNECEGMCGV